MQKRVFYLMLATAGAYIMFKYLLSWFLPCIIAILLAAILEPVMSFLCGKLRLSRTLAALTLSLAMILLIIGTLIFGVSRVISEAGAFIKRLPDYLAPLFSLIRSAEENITLYIGTASSEAQNYLYMSLEAIREQSSGLPAFLYSKLFKSLGDAAKRAPDIIFFFLTFSLSLFFTLSGFPVIKSFLQKQIPERMRKTVSRIKTGTFSAIGTWLRAQLMLMALNFTIVAISLFLIRSDSVFFLALLIAVVDALPLAGAGVILLPWSIFCFASGDAGRGIFLIIIYVVLSLMRSILEPKILGSKSGLHPVASLTAVYAGFRVCGMAGMIIFPVLLMLLKQFNDKGYIKLWK